jgi:AbiV family abortive infection protein
MLVTSLLLLPTTRINAPSSLAEWFGRQLCYRTIHRANHVATDSGFFLQFVDITNCEVTVLATKRNRGYQLSSMMLRGYRKAAVDNSRELQYEAALLLRHNHFARAYFLAVTSIEEMGKAMQAFDALGRNVRDPAVSARVRLNFEDYPKRMLAAVFHWMQMNPEVREEVMPFIEGLIESKRTSEPAVYMGIDPHSSKISTPNGVIGPHAARRCVHMAQSIFANTVEHVMDAPPKIRTKAEDEFFAMKPTVLQAMTETEDFWRYYVSCLKTGDAAFEAAVVEYSRLYFAKSIKFKEEGKPPADDLNR